MRLMPRFALPLLVLVSAVWLCPAQTTPQPAPPPAQAEGTNSPESKPAPAGPEAVPAAKPQDAPGVEAPRPDVKPAQATPVDRGSAAVPTAPAQPNPSLEPPPARKTAAGPAPKPAVAPAPGDKPYVIGATDVLYIRVWNNQNLTGMVDVRPDGMISLALIGEIKADGLTVPQLVDVLKERLGEYLNTPEVDVQVTKPNSKKFFIIGEVGRPGEYPLIGRTTILEALSSAGGFRETANQKKIYLLRGAVKHSFNYKDVIEGKHLEQDIAIENGDRIVVPQ